MTLRALRDLAPANSDVIYYHSHLSHNPHSSHTKLLTVNVTNNIQPSAFALAVPLSGPPRYPHGTNSSSPLPGFYSNVTSQRGNPRAPCKKKHPSPIVSCPILLTLFSFFLFWRFYLFIFRERGKEGERGEKHQCVVASHAPPTGDLACNPCVCPNWELNWRPFGSQDGTQSTEPHQPGLFYFSSCPLHYMSFLFMYMSGSPPYPHPWQNISFLKEFCLCLLLCYTLSF